MTKTTGRAPKPPWLLYLERRRRAHERAARAFCRERGLPAPVPWNKRNGAEIIAQCHAAELLGRSPSKVFVTLVWSAPEQGFRVVGCIIETAPASEAELETLRADELIRSILP